MLNLCQANHETHESKLVETLYGPLWIWDWEQYMGFPNYCSGQDEVSKSIDLQQVWERADSEFFCKVLDEKPGRVYDFGSHIGWFTLLALERGCEVHALDADPENMWLLESKNLTFRQWSGHFSFDLNWIADVDPETYGRWPLRLMKVDVEGHEHKALDLTRHLWANRKVDYGLWELSPIFEKREGIMARSYADLVDEIASYGYRWFILKDEGEWEITGTDLTFPQENAWCQRL